MSSSNYMVKHLDILKAPPDFGRAVNPISTSLDRLSPPNNTGTPGLSNLPTALNIALKKSKINRANFEHLQFRGFTKFSTKVA